MDPQSTPFIGQHQGFQSALFQSSMEGRLSSGLLVEPHLSPTDQ